MQNYTAEYELSMKYQYAVHTGDTGCVVSTAWAELQGLEMKTNQQPTGITVTKLELEPLQWERKGKI